MSDTPLEREPGDDWRLSISHVSVILGANRLLSDVTFHVSPRQMVGVVGASGAGKSTLVRTVTGAEAPTSGTVRLGPHDLHRDRTQVAGRIGYVPQDDALHGGLTARATLEYAARLRLPDLTVGDRAARIDEVVAELALTSRIDARVNELSGGQRKRLSVALELLSRPSVIILDEPTSGLDPANERSMMSLLRQLADGGRAVMVVTHSTESLHLCDRLLFLAPGGVPVYFGEPADLAGTLGVNSVLDAFTLVMTHPNPENIRTAHRDDPAELPPPAVTATGPQSASGQGPTTWAREGPRVGNQFWIVLQRSIAVLVADVKTFRIIALQGLVLGLLILLAFRGGRLNPDSVRSSASSFLMAVVLAIVFIAMASTIREIASERPIARRDFNIGLSPLAYVLAKLCLHTGLIIIQSFIVAVLVLAAQQPSLSGPLLQPTITVFTVLAAVGIAGTSAGIALSASANSTERALTLLPFALFSQLLLAGVIVPLNNVATQVLSWTAIARWGLDGVGSAVDLWSLRACDYGASSTCSALWQPSAAHVLVAYAMLVTLACGFGALAWRLAARSASPTTSQPSQSGVAVFPSARTGRSAVGAVGGEPLTVPHARVALAVRMASWAIDGAVVAILVTAANSIPLGVAALIAAVGMPSAYLIVLPAVGFDTLGHVAMGIRIVRADTGAVPTTLQCVARPFIVALLAFPFLAGVVMSALTMHRDTAGRAWHDMATATVAVRVRQWNVVRRRTIPGLGIPR